ncbi:MAG: fumarylacetoacetate hydrolase family protein [Gammaproteobacteria bacterium]
MKLRRVTRGDAIKVQAKSKRRWIDLERAKGVADMIYAKTPGESVIDIIKVLSLSTHQLENLQSQLDQLDAIEDEKETATLPFKPASFRDFMLYEQHVIDASRGYVKRFMPSLYPVTKLVERLTGKSFKKFRPHPLWYKQPIYYLSNHLNIGISGDEIAWPAYTQALDYELEMGAVLSKPLFNASPEEARAAIGGFVVLNDFSARDVQKDEMESGFGPQKAKHFVSTISTVVVSADEILPHINDLKASVLINGENVAQCHSNGMFHDLGQAISFASKDEQLHPGELFGTGTLPGGGGMENGHWLSPGDEISLQIERIGELINTIKGPV